MEHFCDFDLGHDFETCGLPAKFYIRRVKHNGDPEDFIRCSIHTGTLAKNFANSLDDPLHYRAFEARYVG